MNLSDWSRASTLNWTWTTFYSRCSVSSHQLEKMTGCCRETFKQVFPVYIVSEMLCLNMRMRRYYRMVTFGKFRRNLQTQTDKVVKYTPECVFLMFQYLHLASNEHMRRRCLYLFQATVSPPSKTTWRLRASDLLNSGLTRLTEDMDRLQRWSRQSECFSPEWVSPAESHPGRCGTVKIKWSVKGGAPHLKSSAVKTGSQLQPNFFILRAL